ncbi:MAG TPA: transcriptional regulator [Elusimicrobia bacterium]|nr:transcriptional regulator [Elusimicrobiota bacterium]HBT62533.1 transcriptional regulator [Elusimicrobiota bacterium]
MRQALVRALDSGAFILGPEVRQFETEFAAALGSRHAVGVSNGTDALRIALEAVGVGPQDEVLVPSFTFIATATAVSALGAKPVFVDIDPDTMTMAAADAAQAVTPRAKAILPVHLFGQPADMDGLLALAREKGLKVVEDCAQAHLTSYKGRTVGAIADAGAFSFYPSKNLGAVGDAGAVTAQDDALAESCRQLRNCGRVTGGPAYRHARVGQNCRLDELQAAVLRVKLKHLTKWTEGRRQAAARYIEGLAGLPLRLPDLGQGGSRHSFHLFVIRCDRRDELARHLTERGIGNAVYYPIPIHQQPAYQGLAARGLPRTEEAARTALALPMYPELEPSEVDLVCRAVKDFFGK